MKNTHPAYRLITYGLGLLLLTVLSAYLARTIIDFDFFWHLKTGQWIWENRQLPASDIFSYTTPHPLSSRGLIILTSYWLSQTLYYLLYQAGGFGGIILLRFLITAGLLYFMAKRQQGDDLIFRGLAVVFIAALLEAFPMDRPQVFSFLCFAFLLYAMDKILKPDAAGLSFVMLALPLTMLAWANLHAGFILGQGTILLYLVSEGVKFLHPSLGPASRDGYRRLLLSGSAAISVSFINPNTYHVMEEIFRETMFTTGPMITEYLPAITYFRVYHEPALVLYWLVMLVTLIGAVLAGLRRPDLTQLILLAGTGYFSFTQVRYIPFFLIAAVPAATRYLSGERFLLKARAVVLALAIAAAVFFAWDERSNISNIFTGNWLQGSTVLPAEAAEFIAATDLQGNMYNYYDWGGYLIWRLGPSKRVFADGRALNDDILRRTFIIDDAVAGDIEGLPLWKSTLSAFSIKYVVFPMLLKDRKIAPLVKALLSEKEWIPVFSGANSIVFVKDTPENSGIIRKYAIPGPDIINKMNAAKTESGSNIR